ncbi:hypothetical protein BHF71_08190 [Vulcanibacillus modesticaldus]|uniref:Uncharacterized protein n=1 Tax=Vulcanibacillus modesticaldus TaxID=337097 RepID=A0A1D2YV49_9BACI|nr:spore germination protein GerPE [Vulcanibacillus modesticaldus]OEF99592.1 hypothetical protein BHF71_08190 [Vulcanibacillus modesticaldus]
MNRISKVNNIKIINVISSATVITGDTKIIEPRAKILAVQREIPIFYEDEGNIYEYPLFLRPIPKPVALKIPVKTKVLNIKPLIEVDNIKILSIAASGVFQIGSTNFIDNQVRVKHFRQILYDNPSFQKN